jgi:hypothetical protein
MKMVGYQRPRKTSGLGLLDNCPKPLYKVVPVCVVFKNIRPFNPTGNDVMQRPWCIYSGLPWQEKLIAQTILYINLKYLERPQNTHVLGRLAKHFDGTLDKDVVLDSLLAVMPKFHDHNRKAFEVGYVFETP